MNCRSCNTTIDYKFLSDCSECGTEVKPEIVSQPIELFNEVPSAPQEKRVSWSRGVANVLYVLITSLAGMVSGAVVVYFTAGMFFMALLSSGSDNPHESCSRGMAIGMLSILSGAFLGTAGGSAYATKHFVIKRAAE